MKKKLILICIIMFYLTSCGDVGKVLRNEKIRTTDEFLVKKKTPLVLPPNYEKIPEPGSIMKEEINQEEKLKKILRAPKINQITDTKQKNIEETILKKIKE